MSDTDCPVSRGPDSPSSESSPHRAKPDIRCLTPYDPLRAGHRFATARPPLLVLILWTLAAFVSALCGIGGGLFAVPILHYLGRMPMRLAIGTSLVLVCALSATATVAEGLHEAGALEPLLIALLVAGGVAGARTGFGVAQRLDPTRLKRIFAVVLVAAGARLLAMQAGPEGTLGDFAPTALRALGVVVIGFGGGFLAPLLGVGGGLLVVPALFLGLPSIGYLDARASSMAMTVVVSAQSAWLYLRARSVDIASLPWFAATAVVGAVLGVLAVHLPGWADGARVVMAAVLLLLALRFARDSGLLWRGRSAPAKEAAE